MKNKIAVAMSGGVDSSVAALRLVEQGEDVFGVMLRLWSAGPELENRCCSPADLANARSIAAQLDIPFYVLDVKSEFKTQVVNAFLDGYANGLTPNPCISCNRQIRWGWLLERVLAMGATHLATGHYARVRARKGNYELIRAVDHSKDQSYVLHVLSQDQLSKAVFPIGDLQKSDVRTLAKDHSLPVADRQDSQDLCFLGSMDYRDFLKLEGSDLLDPGPIVNTNGEQIGMHSGLASYTIGQRKGIGISSNEPYYVVEKDILQNTLVVGHRDKLGRINFEIGNLNWIQEEIPFERDDLCVQVRYKTKPVEARIVKANEGSINVILAEPITAITHGQWAVFYDQEICLGGGMILP